jgi:hypothetical protein
MLFSFLLPVWALVAFVIYKVVSTVIENRRHAGMHHMNHHRGASALPPPLG